MIFSKRLLHLLCVETTLMVLSVRMEPAVRLKLVPLTEKSVDEIYLQARKYNAKNYNQPERIDPKTKKNIYTEIFATDILKHYCKTVNMDFPPMTGMLPENVRQDLLDSTDHTCGLIPRYMYRNERQTVEVNSLEESVQENAFLCLVLKPSHTTKDLQSVYAFYISDEYNVNMAPGRYTAARFIFQHSGDALVLDHLAEEPATVLETSGPKLERVYLNSRSNTKTARREEDDPVCKMDPMQRVQICSSVFYSSYFDHFKKFFYYTQIESLSSACAKINVSFEYLSEPDGVHREWMLWCPAFLIEKGAVKGFSISRGDKPDNVFVYVHNISGQSSEKVAKYYLANLSTNVRNVTLGFISPSIPNEDTGSSKEPASSLRVDDFHLTFRHDSRDNIESTSSSVAKNNDE